MSGHMKLCLNEEILKTLRSLKGYTLKKQTYNPSPGGSASPMFLHFSNICLALNNDYDYRDNKEEYPTLHISLSDGIPTINQTHYKDKIIDKTVLGITIIRDHLEWFWNEQYWIMDNDIAIKLTFADKEVIYAVENFMSKTLDIIETDTGAEKTALEDLFFELWTFKENVLKKFERTEIPL